MARSAVLLARSAMHAGTICRGPAALARAPECMRCRAGSAAPSQCLLASDARLPGLLSHVLRAVFVVSVIISDITY